MGVMFKGGMSMQYFLAVLAIIVIGDVNLQMQRSAERQHNNV